MDSLKHLLFVLVVSMPLTLAAGGAAQPPDPGVPAGTTPDGIGTLLRQIEQMAQRGDPREYMTLLARGADQERAIEFAFSEFSPATRAVLRERDRAAFQETPPGRRYRVIADLFIENGNRARISTWQLDVARVESTDEWRISDQEQLTTLGNLYRLSLASDKQFDVRDLTITAEDLDLTLAEGSAFVADTEEGVTGLVLVGRGDLRFHPEPEAERGQMRIFAGADTLETRFEAAFIRMNPADFDYYVDTARLEARPVDPRAFRRAEEIFREEAPKSYGVKLGELSPHEWSLLPTNGDIVADIRTRRFDTLTYARSGADAEDITLFQRARKRNIALYSSAGRRDRLALSLHEDDAVDYDVLHYDIELTVAPARQWIEGRARIRLKTRAYALATLKLRLADSLTVQSIVSEELGHLFGLRVVDQNSVVINLPTTIEENTQFELTVTYGGPVKPEDIQGESISVDGAAAGQQEGVILQPEMNILYSNRAYWYPQAPVTDYATATLKITVPPNYGCVGTGELAGEPTSASLSAPKTYVFAATQPVRYLAFVVSRFVRSSTAQIALGEPPDEDEEVAAMPGVSYKSLDIVVESNPRQIVRARGLASRAADIAQFYTSIIGDYPYPSFTLALLENNLPGGHSPGYFAALNQPLPTSPFSWRHDPAAFDDYPEFFLAHEMAHQWWGQAVGWRNYHEQWLSEGFAQYFAALYARHFRGEQVFDGVMREIRKWAMDESDQGPVYLGYRVGHIRGEGHVFRAVVYNKSAAVLHMLRLLAGDEAFFRGIRRFYRESRFRKVGTQEFRAAMEAETGLPLGRFFDRWIFGSALPTVRVSHRVEKTEAGGDVLLRVEQVDELFDFPLVVTLHYADRRRVDVVVPVTERQHEVRLPLNGPLRELTISNNDGTLARILR